MNNEKILNDIELAQCVRSIHRDVALIDDLSANQQPAALERVLQRISDVSMLARERVLELMKSEE